MQNVYDLAHELVRSLKETDQFKDFADAQKALKENEQVYNMMNDFQQKSMEFQTKTMMGEQPDMASGYLNAQMALQTIIADIYKIIGEAVDVE